MRTILTNELKEAREAAERDLTAEHAQNRDVMECISHAVGVTIRLVREDDLRSTGVAIAMNKTWTAEADRLSTHVSAIVTHPWQPRFGVSTKHSGESSLLTGELSIIVDSVVAGCVSVRGADVEVGAAVTVAAKTALTDLL